MTTTFVPSVTSHGRFDASVFIVVFATTFNMGLCYFYTTGFPVGSAGIVAACEIIVSAWAIILAKDAISDRALLGMLMLIGYLFALWLIREGSGPKIVRDLMIPFVYYYLGVERGTPERVDGLVRLLLVVVLGVALLEWLDLASYTKLFDISGYFLAKGMIPAAQMDNDVTGTGVGLYISGMRIEGRNFLPFLEPILGLHRVSSVFLEPIELSDFAVIAYAWLLCRFRAHAMINSLSYMVIAFLLIAFCDSRFASMTCVIITFFHLAGLSKRSSFVVILPVILFTFTLLLPVFWHPVEVGDDLMGRLYTSGSLLASFSISEWFGLRESLGPIGDAGYAYVVTYAGFFTAVALWAAFVAGSGSTPLARSVRGAIAIYAALLLTVSSSLFSIKTGALLWYIYGAVANSKSEGADV